MGEFGDASRSLGRNTGSHARVGFHGYRVRVFCWRKRAWVCTIWGLGSPTDSLANGVVKGRPSAFPIPDYGKFSDGFSKMDLDVNKPPLGNLAIPSFSEDSVSNRP
ncbi:hypothetical protein VitviT2T_002753 [Vitis vinifera]|uniref:Uncharacterized protein n=1 Tax=Vitis vinifera TaxID=29760 RepID=A0ABY9BJT8_VITVI|nr:hypothetical protein VitviT2T_002750 [Vitis vinifera]WJZ83039.1 hypothetical protein VitviT2T_002753 [Vitis vinifera]